MKSMQKGFTLIELMIVIAIIGILASIAFPAYQDYTARSQAVEALQATAGIQGDVAVDTANAGSLTATTDTIAAAQDLEGKYFKAKSASVTSGGIISVKFDSGALNGQTMTLTPTLNAAKNQIASWKCTGLSKNNTLPSGCR